MAKQENKPRKAEWFLDYNVATIDQFLSLAQELKSEATIGPPASINISFTGSKDGIDFAGEPDEVASEIKEFPNLEFISANIKAKFVESKQNIQVDVSLKFLGPHLALNIQNASSSFANNIFDIIIAKFPPEPPLSAEEEESLSNQLTNLIEHAKEAVASSEKAKEARQAAEKDLSSLEKNVEEIKKKLEDITQATKTVNQQKEKSAKEGAEIANAKAQAQADQEAAQKSREKIGALEAQVQKFYEEIEENRKKLTDTIKKANDTVEENKGQTGQIINENKELQDEIKEHLQKAVGASLFGAFKKRKEQIFISKWIWAAIIAVLILLQSGIFLWFTYNLSPEGLQQPFYERIGFILRLLVSVPIIFFICYAIRQYAKERDFEELYAFKSALSFSLSPYIDLVKNLSSSDDDRKTYSEFVVKTIGQIFEKPMGSDTEEKQLSKKDSMLVRDILDRLIDLIERAKKG